MSFKILVLNECFLETRELLFNKLANDMSFKILVLNESFLETHELFIDKFANDMSFKILVCFLLQRQAANAAHSHQILRFRHNQRLRLL